MKNNKKVIIWDAEGRAFELTGIFNYLSEPGPGTIYYHDPCVKNSGVRRRRDLDLPERSD